MTPSISILVPVKNAAGNIQQLLENLAALEYDHQKLSLTFLEGDSEDGSFECLKRFTAPLKGLFGSVRIHKHDLGTALYLQERRREISYQRDRRARIAMARNRLLHLGLNDQEFALWIDADMLWWPPGILNTLLKVRADIVTPHCSPPDRFRSFDLNAFRFAEGMADAESDMIDGIFQPPPGGARLYLHDFLDKEEIELDSVGGTMLLVRADVHRDGLNFPPVPFEGYIETEGLGRMARRLGLKCVGLPNVRVVHV